MQTSITFEYEKPSIQVFTSRIKQITMNYYYLVYELDGVIVGYAYANRQRERAAYQWNAELSIYIDQAFISQGIGNILLKALVGLLKLQGIRTVYGCITLPNEPSARLHRSLGFSCIGVYYNTGYKCGKWHDVAWYEKQIAPYDDGPDPMIPFSQCIVNYNDDIDNILQYDN